MQYLFADGELLIVVLDGLLVVSHGRVGVADVLIGAAHASAVLQQPRDVEVRLVQLQRRVVVPHQLVHDAQVAARVTLGTLQCRACIGDTRVRVTEN